VLVKFEVVKSGRSPILIFSPTIILEGDFSSRPAPSCPRLGCTGSRGLYLHNYKSKGHGAGIYTAANALKCPDVTLCYMLQFITEAWQLWLPRLLVLSWEGRGERGGRGSQRYSWGLCCSGDGLAYCPPPEAPALQTQRQSVRLPTKYL